MTTVKQLLGKKGHQVFSIQPDDTVYNAIQKMADENIGCLVVMNGEKLVGVITERHYARSVILNGRASSKTPVRAIMETRVIYARPEHSVEECMALMTEKIVRHLPVIDEGKLIGIISVGDLVKSIIGDQKFKIDQLEHYMHGGA
jgi:CBS domain-containing protein